eukprot:1565976-Rhodomonas_salina.1
MSWATEKPDTMLGRTEYYFAGGKWYDTFEQEGNAGELHEEFNRGKEQKAPMEEWTPPELSLGPQADPTAATMGVRVLSWYTCEWKTLRSELLSHVAILEHLRPSMERTSRKTARPA